MNLLRKQLLAILATVFMFVSNVSPAKGQAPTPFANCRLGAGGVTGDVVGYNLEQLNVGLYTDWRARATRPAGLPADIEYIQTVRVHQLKDCGITCSGSYVEPPTYTVSPGLDTLASWASTQPGLLWLIGNEIDRRDWGSGDTSGGQDEITAELYATAFHEIRNVIKTADPTAKIAIAGLVQATPLRLEYLDRIWDSYYTQYGYPMGNDIDIWNVHGFILREVRHEWGADTPPGFSGPGFLAGADEDTCIAAHHDMSYFREFIEAFRTWMAEHGERNKPLLITEYGILYGTLGISQAQIINFMSSTFDYLLDAKDTETGYPADEDRLVQGWIWYSLNDDTTWYHDAALFDSTTKNLTALGYAWKSYVSDPGNPLASQPQLNLSVTNLRADQNPYVVLPGETTTVTLRVDVANSGNTATNTDNHLLVTLWDGVPDVPGSNLIASQTLDDLQGCGGFATVEANWPGRGAGDHTWYAKVELVADETSFADNMASSVVSVLENPPDADLAMSKVVDNSTPYEGIGSFHYFVAVTNNGPDPVTGVVVNDLLPDGVTFESYAASQGNYYSAGPWTVGTLVNGAHAVLTITVRVDSGQAGNTLTNSASASADRNDSVPGNDTASVDIVPLASFKTYLPVVLK